MGHTNHEPPKACVFDAYGTLFDFASAASRCGDIPGNQQEALNRIWRDKQLQYTWLRSIQDKYADFWQITGDALDFTLETLGLGTPGLRVKLMDAYRTLNVFPEVPEVLERLKLKGIKSAILSNGTSEMLRSAVSNAKIGGLLDAVLSVEEVGVYKPHPRVYQLACDRLGYERQAISYQSSNAWDAYAAAAFGFRAIWCNRYAQPQERLPGLPEEQVTSLRDLPFLG